MRTDHTAEPTPLDDAIRAQKAVVNQLADQHALEMTVMQETGDKLATAHDALSVLLAKKSAA